MLFRIPIPVSPLFPTLFFRALYPSVSGGGGEGEIWSS